MRHVTIGSQVYELYKTYTHTVEYNRVNSNVFYSIRDYLVYNSNSNSNSACPMFYAGDFLSSVGNDLKDAKGVKITTRVYQWLWKVLQYKPTKEQKDYVGNLLTNATIKARIYEFEIVDNFNWDAGDFGDDGSCFWSDRNGARKSLMDAGCLAIRFYDNDVIVGRNYDVCPSEPIYGKAGMARAWLFPWDKEQGRYVLFNGYGIETKEIAQLLGSLTGLYVYRIGDLTNHGYTASLIYIGGGDRSMFNGSTGYLLTPIKDDPDQEEIDLDIYEQDEEEEEEEEEEEPVAYCDDCDSPIYDEDDLYNVNDRYVCSNCYNNYTACDCCHDLVHNDDMEQTDDNYSLCSYCYRNETHECEHCHEVHYSTRNMASTQTCEGEDICVDCADHYYVVCCDCGDYVHLDDEIISENLNHYCPGCAEDILEKCADCGDLHETNLLTKGLCNACQRSHAKTLLSG